MSGRYKGDGMYKNQCTEPIILFRLSSSFYKGQPTTFSNMGTNLLEQYLSPPPSNFSTNIIYVPVPWSFFQNNAIQTFKHLNKTLD